MGRITDQALFGKSQVSNEIHLKPILFVAFIAPCVSNGACHFILLFIGTQFIVQTGFGNFRTILLLTIKVIFFFSNLRNQIRRCNGERKTDLAHFSFYSRIWLNSERRFIFEFDTVCSLENFVVRMMTCYVLLSSSLC